ncbi:hypothetical protein KC19_8G114100 [Ceratodon purpureus]|uniref:Uncharacterized protein n=1 Tax=Ceratodon purpureus TaxID=3225 RepID=A0A8T0H2B1_CERPU|nr:hypothetical protein KC19_8G114100 [Ceratodon purpureus]
MSNLCVVANPEGGVEVKEEGAHEVTVFFLESSKKVLWIEANEKFVDILLNFLLLPVGVAVQAVSRQAHAIEGRLNPIGGLGNIFANFQSPGMDGKVSTSEVIAKLLNPPPVLCNPTQLMNAYACAYMQSEPNWSWSRKNKGQLDKLHEMAKWHTYIVTEALEVHPSSVAKGMDLLRDVQFGKVIKKKRIFGSDEVLKLLRASLTKASPSLNEVFRWNDNS